ncbi:hypothetical protein GQ457_17G018990 [Hibiscus cannabinus]
MSRKLEALVYYDGEMLSDPSFGVVFQANNTVTFKISRRSTFEVLNELVYKKAPHGRGRQLQSIKYRLPTSLEPLTYSVFHVGDDGDVLMMLETNCQYSFGGPIELLATFSDGEAGCSNQVRNWGRANFISIQMLRVLQHVYVETSTYSIRRTTKVGRLLTLQCIGILALLVLVST